MILPKAKHDYYRGSDPVKAHAAKEHNNFAKQINLAIERLYERQVSIEKNYDLFDIAREARISESIVAKIGLNTNNPNGMTLYKNVKIAHPDLLKME